MLGIFTIQRQRCRFTHAHVALLYLRFVRFVLFTPCQLSLRTGFEKNNVCGQNSFILFLFSQGKFTISIYLIEKIQRIFVLPNLHVFSQLINTFSLSCVLFLSHVTKCVLNLQFNMRQRFEANNKDKNVLFFLM